MFVSSLLPLSLVTYSSITIKLSCSYVRWADQATGTNTVISINHCSQIEWLKEFHNLLYVDTEDYTHSEMLELIDLLKKDSLLPQILGAPQLRGFKVYRSTLQNAMRASIVINDFHIIVKLLKVIGDVFDLDHLPQIGCVTLYHKKKCYLVLKTQDLMTVNQRICHFT